MTRLLPALLALLLPALAMAEGRGVLVVNGTGETIRSITIAPAGAASPGAGAGGENRLRSFLPGGAQARIGYSTGCRADIRLGFESGRTEAFLDQDACADLRVTAGQGVATAAEGGGPAPAGSRGSPGQKSAKAAKTAKPGAYVPVTVAVPPWTGHSITKKFGGLD